MISRTYPPHAISGILFGQWTYWSALIIALWGYAYMPEGSIRTALILTPVLPALLIVCVAFWVYRSCDEYVRSRILRCVAVTAIFVATCTFGCFLLELFGYPRLSMLWINILGWSMFSVQMLYTIMRSR